MARLIIFDLDGTLVDSRQDLADAGNAARAALALPALPLAEITRMIGDGARTLIARLTPDCDETARTRAMQAFRADYANRLTATTRPYPGVPALLSALRARGWCLAVATNKPAEFAAPILAALDLPYDALRGGSEPKKPDPGMLLDLMRATGAGASDTWMVGDHRTDLEAAQRAGVRAIHCAWGFGLRDGQPATAVAQVPDDILRIVDG